MVQWHRLRAMVQWHTEVELWFSDTHRISYGTETQESCGTETQESCGSVTHRELWFTNTQRENYGSVIHKG